MFLPSTNKVGESEPLYGISFIGATYYSPRYKVIGVHKRGGAMKFVLEPEIYLNNGFKLHADSHVCVKEVLQKTGISMRIDFTISVVARRSFNLSDLSKCI
jgi:hypothetical protein